MTVVLDKATVEKFTNVNDSYSGRDIKDKGNNRIWTTRDGPGLSWILRTKNSQAISFQGRNLTETTYILRDNEIGDTNDAEQGTLFCLFLSSVQNRLIQLSYSLPCLHCFCEGGSK